MAHPPEKFMMTLKQDGNEISGIAEFADHRKTKATVTGKISEDKVLLVMKPDSDVLFEVSWVGHIKNGNIEGKWYLHGKPPRGNATSGPWSGKMQGVN